jgi:hypothetical protein
MHCGAEVTESSTNKQHHLSGSAACQACATFETTASTASVSAAACVCEAGAWLNSGACVACPAGTFKTGPGNQACGACPAFSASPPGSDAAADCQCNAGYSGPDGVLCEACESGKYKTDIGSAACTSCPANSGHLLIAQTLSTACVCFKGYTNNQIDSMIIPYTDHCKACHWHYYKSTNGSASCTSCPENSGHSLTAQVDISPCLCFRGYSGFAGLDGQPCSECAVGTFKDFYGNGLCTACPNGSTTTSTSARWIADCQCNVGFSGPDGGTCIACSQSTFKATIGSGSCSGCPENSGHILTAQSSNVCVCNLGYTGANGVACSACASGTYKSAAGSAACAACPANSTSLPSSANITACLCDAGFGGPPGGPCALCAAGTYELGRVCLPCAANSDSVPGAVGATACLCRAGYFGPPGGPCRPCAHGSFSAANSSACAACGPNANTSAPAASSVIDCLCVPGHSPLSAACSACPANTFKPTLGNASCTACTTHSTSPPGSTSLDACACLLNFLKRAGNGTCARVCAAGFEAGGASLTECVGCRPGFYKTLEGDHACTPCPPNAFSLLANQTSVASCVCQHGYIFNATTLRCDACPPGTQIL